MRFTDDTEEALRAAVSLVNSAENPGGIDLETFLVEYPYTGRIDRNEPELAALQSLRPRLRDMLLAPRDDMAAAVNSALSDVALHPRLTRHDGTDWHLHAVHDERPLPERILVETAMALIDVIRADEGSRISICADADCEAVALDLSRNRSKKYCSTTCANRNAVAAYRARRVSADR